MTGVPARLDYATALRRATIGVALAHRSIQTMPNRTPGQRVARANAMMDALRVPRMGDWRPTFPFTA